MTRPVAAAVDLLKARPVMTERLITTHIPDDHGRCRGCTRPGYGTPYLRWPCTPYALAALAQREAALPISEES